MKNVVVELIRNEEGVLLVNECGLGEWSWLSYVWGGDFELDIVRGGEWKDGIEKVLKVFEDDEELSGDEMWEEKRKEFLNVLNGVDWGNVSMCRIGGYSVEYDNCVCVILSVED